MCTLQNFKAWGGRLGQRAPRAMALLLRVKLSRRVELGVNVAELVALPTLEESGDSPVAATS